MELAATFDCSTWTWSQMRKEGNDMTGRQNQELETQLSPKRDKAALKKLTNNRKRKRKKKTHRLVPTPSRTDPGHACRKRIACAGTRFFYRHNWAEGTSPRQSGSVVAKEVIREPRVVVIFLAPCRLYIPSAGTRDGAGQQDKKEATRELVEYGACVQGGFGRQCSPDRSRISSCHVVCHSFAG